ARAAAGVSGAVENGPTPSAPPFCASTPLEDSAAAAAAAVRSTSLRVRPSMASVSQGAAEGADDVLVVEDDEIVVLRRREDLLERLLRARRAPGGERAGLVALDRERRDDAPLRARCASTQVDRRRLGDVRVAHSSLDPARFGVDVQ